MSMRTSEGILRGFCLRVLDSSTEMQCHHFFFGGEQAEGDRDTWLDRMLMVINSVTMTLFPMYHISVWPLPSVASTSRRILAGCLLLYTGMQPCYCQLTSYSCGRATFTVYTDSLCNSILGCLKLTSSTSFNSFDDSFSNMFCISSYYFCARSWEEKALWTRTIVNVMTKLRYAAPEPSAADITVMRSAVLERAEELLPDMTDDSVAAEILPLKPRCSPILSPRGFTST